MASTESPQKGGDFVLGLSAREAKLIILGKVCTKDDGKIDYEKLGALGGYTTGSAQVTYRKALRKLLDANPELEANGKTGRTASADGTPAGKKTAAGGKRKSASATTTPVKKTEAPAETGGGDETAATVAGAVADFVAAANEEASLETPSKRARKTSTKKGIAQKVNKKDQAANKNDENAATTPKPKGKTATKKSPAKSPVKEEEPATDTADTLAPAVKDEDPDFNLAGNSSVEREIDAMQG